MQTPPSPPLTLQTGLLAVGVGSLTTTAALFDTVDHAHHLIACRTVPTRPAAPASGLDQALAELGHVLQRPLSPSTPAPARIAVANSPQPLAVTLVALAQDGSLAAARQLLQTCDAVELDAHFPGDGRTESQRLADLCRQPGDVMLLAGGRQGAPLLPLAELVSVACAQWPTAQHPTVLFAGHRALRTRIGAIFAGQTAVLMLDDLREASAAIAATLTDFQTRQTLMQQPGMAELADRLTAPITAELDALTAVTRYIATLQNGRVLLADLGSRHCTLIDATPQATRVTRSNEAGMGRGMACLATATTAAELQTWLPDDIPTSAIIDYCANHALFPQTVPLTDTAVHITLAAARHHLNQTAAIHAADDQRPWDIRLLVLRGATLARAPQPGHALLAALDALQPGGIFAVALDPHGLLPLVGALATTDAVAAVQVLEHGVLQDLGWVVVPTGPPRPGQPILHVTVTPDSPQSMDIMVNYGNLEMIPLPAGQPSRIRLEPVHGADIGRGANQPLDISIQGGKLGLIIDARGRPLQLPQDSAARSRLLRDWLWTLAGSET